MATLQNTYTGATSSGTTVTVTSVAPTGSNRVMYVQVTLRPYTADVTSVVFNGSENAVKVDERSVTSGNTNKLEVWRLTAPSVTTASVVVTADLSGSIAVIVSTWDTVDQATPEDATTKDGNTGSATASLAGTLTWGGGSDVLYLAVGNRDTTSSWTADAGVTQREIRDTGSSSTASRTVLLTDANTETGKVLGAFGSSPAWNAIGFNINAASGGGSSIAAIVSGYQQRGMT